MCVWCAAQPARAGRETGQSEWRQQPGLRFKHQRARAGDVFNRSYCLQGTAVEDYYLATAAIAHIAKLAGIVEGDRMGIDEVCNGSGRVPVFTSTTCTEWPCAM